MSLINRPESAQALMLIHGLSDDNVVVAHTLRLSAALLAAGRMHTVLPLTGATHMANDPAIAENLLLLELEFIRRELGIPTGHEDGNGICVLVIPDRPVR